MQVKVLQLKNKFASPTPMGYRDFNLNVQVEIGGGRPAHVCEVGGSVLGR